MDSFKIYLPSNASTDHFPNNSASEYRTKLKKPIELTGKWEVGLESLFYSSEVKNKNEKARIELEVKAEQSEFVNDNTFYQFVVTNDNKWKGMRPCIPRHFETNKSKLQRICDTLNAMNNLIVRQKTLSVFGAVYSFSVNHSGRISYKQYINDFVLRLTPTLAATLGLDDQTNLTSWNEAQHNRVVDEKPLKAKDYTLFYFASSLVKRQRRLIIKERGQNVKDVKQHIMNEINKAGYYGITISFPPGQCIISIPDNDVAVSFSLHLVHIIGHPRPLIGKGTFANRIRVATHTHTNDLWYMDFYTTDLMEYRRPIQLKTAFDVFPYKNNQSLDDVLTNINYQANSRLKDLLKEKLDTERHHFQMEIKKNHTILNLGKWLRVQVSNNLRVLFGLRGNYFTPGINYGVRLVTSLNYNEERLYILADFISETLIGERHVNILREFTHVSSGEFQFERRFYPLIYLPVTKNFIDQIHIQLTNATFKPLKLRDSKTILLLHFRRLQN